ncbi:MAG: paraquat-inducible protein A [Granulosicoccus sp.]
MKIIAGIVLLVIAYCLLFPGLTQPILTVSGTVEKGKLVEVGKELIKESPNTPAMVNNLVDMVVDTLDVTGTVDAFDKTRSILGTAQELYANNHLLVAILIILFSVIVPLIKALILLGMFLPVRQRVKSLLLTVSNAISKWSMADVFVIAIFIAYLAGNGIQESRGMVEFQASLGNGFWFFLAYCLISILGTQILSLGLRPQLELASTEAEDSEETADTEDKADSADKTGNSDKSASPEKAEKSAAEKPQATDDAEKSESDKPTDK